MIDVFQTSAPCLKHSKSTPKCVVKASVIFLFHWCSQTYFFVAPLLNNCIRIKISFLCCPALLQLENAQLNNLFLRLSFNDYPHFWKERSTSVSWQRSEKFEETWHLPHMSFRLQKLWMIVSSPLGSCIEKMQYRKRACPRSKVRSTSLQIDMSSKLEKELRKAGC